VRGTAAFEDASKGVVELELRGLTEPDTLYLAHIHPGTCAQEEEEGEAHGHGEHAEEGGDHGRMEEGHEHDGEEIEYSLSEVKSDSECGGHVIIVAPLCIKHCDSQHRNYREFSIYLAEARPNFALAAF
jgi:hypothetical protein